MVTFHTFFHYWFAVLIAVSICRAILRVSFTEVPFFRGGLMTHLAQTVSPSPRPSALNLLLSQGSIVYPVWLNWLIAAVLILSKWKMDASPAQPSFVHCLVSDLHSPLPSRHYLNHTAQILLLPGLLRRGVASNFPFNVPIHHSRPEQRSSIGHPPKAKSLPILSASLYTVKHGTYHHPLHRNSPAFKQHKWAEYTVCTYRLAETRHEAQLVL